jgi:hypothetical protein
VEPVLHDELTRRVPELPGRLVVDRRGEAHRPRARRAVDPEFRAAQGIGVRRDLGPEIAELAADLGQREDRVGLT